MKQVCACGATLEFSHDSMWMLNGKIEKLLEIFKNWEETHDHKAWR